MELRHLRYFVAVARALHFGRAAENLRLTQPGVSVQIKALERELGVQLFRRSKREVKLTTAGHVFLERAQSILGDAERAIDAARRAHRGETGELILAFSPVIAYELLPTVVQAYVRRFPAVSLSLREMWSTEQALALRAGQVHLGLVYLPIDDAGLVVRPLRRDGMVVALPAGHRLARRDQVTLTALASESWVRLPPQRTPAGRDWMTDIFHLAGFEPRVVEEATQIPTLLGLVAAGIGISLLPAAVGALRFRGVIYRSLAEGGPELETAVAWRSDTDDQTVGAFVAVLMDCISANPMNGLKLGHSINSEGAS